MLYANTKMDSAEVNANSVQYCERTQIVDSTVSKHK